MTLDGLTKEKGNTRARLDLLYHITRELTSALELSQVLERVLFLSLKTVKGLSGSIIVLDDSGDPVESAIIYSGQLFEKTTAQLRDTLEQGLAGWVVKNRKAALVSDTSQDNRWLRKADDQPYQTGPKSTVSAPLMARDRLVGVMTLTHPTPGFFQEEHLDLIEAIAGQAGFAVLNARLYEESKRQARVMSALAESAASINASLNKDEVLQRIIDQTAQALQVDAVSMAMINHETGMVEFLIATDPWSSQIVGKKIPIGKGVVGWVAQESTSVIVPDTQKDPRFYSEIDEITGYSTRSIAAAPIRLKGEVIGVLEAMNPVGTRFSEEALLVLDGIGSMAGTAIDHARLFEEVEETRTRYRDLFEDSIDAILISDETGQIQAANRQAEIITGYQVEALMQRSINQLIEVEWEDVRMILNSMVGENTHCYETMLHTNQSEEIPLEVYVKNVQTEGLLQFQWILHDITERKQIDQLRDDLMGMIYHDLRSPLANVISGLDVLSEMIDLESDPAVKSVIEIASRSTDRVQRLANSLLDITRLEAGQRIGSLEEVAIKDLVDASIEAVLPIVESKEQQLTYELSDELPPIFVDQDMIRRVLINLLENSVKYSPSESKISVGANALNQEVEIWVEDTGRGIREEDQRQIFEKFNRLDAKDTSVKRGLGLGLAFCKMAVEAHSGSIRVESREQSGSKFIFTLPINGMEKA